MGRDVAQPGRVLRSGRRSRWFEPSHPDHFCLNVVKKLILIVFLIPVVAFAVFFFSFSSFSEDDGCVVVLNSFKSGVTFDDLVFTSEDNAEKCNKYNTLVLNTYNDKSVLKFAQPLKIKMDNISFFVSAAVPEKRADDPAIALSEVYSEEVRPSGQGNQENLRTHFPDKETDFAIYYLYNDPASSSEELDDALLDVQEKEVDLILTGKYSAPKKNILRPNLVFLENSKTPELSVLVFSVMRFDSGEKQVIVRSFHKRSL